MLDETLLVAAVCGSRKAYEEAQNIGINFSSVGDAAAFVIRAAGEQYRRDTSQSAVDENILRTQIERKYGTGSMARSILDFVSTLPKDISGINVVEEVRLTHIARLATDIATRLATGVYDETTNELIEQYQKLSTETGNDESYRLEPEDFEGTAGERIRLSPQRLNNFIGGGVIRGHNITVYGRPESGKSMFALNQAACCLRQGLKVLYVANEEPSQEITRRLLARLTGTPIKQLNSVDKITTAIANCRQAYDLWHLFHKAGATYADISRQAAIIKPDLIVVDQLKNISISEDNRALQLDKLARQVRELGIKHNAVTMSVTQAGESAQNHKVLTMSDIEWSNTGIPGAADLMVGIGVDEEFDGTKQRMLSIPKNKVNARHGAFPVFVDPQTTAFLSKRRV